MGRRDEGEAERKRRKSDDADPDVPQRARREERRDREPRPPEDEGRRKPKKRHDEAPATRGENRTNARAAELRESKQDGPVPKKRRVSDADADAMLEDPPRPKKKKQAGVGATADKSTAKRRSDGGDRDEEPAGGDRRRAAPGAADDVQALAADGVAAKGDSDPKRDAERCAQQPSKDAAAAGSSPPPEDDRRRQKAAEPLPAQAGGAGGKSAVTCVGSNHGGVLRRCSSSGSESSVDSRKKRRASLKAAMGFSAPAGVLPSPGPNDESLSLLPEKVRGLLDQNNLARDMAKMRQFMENKGPDKPAKTPREEGTETVLRMPGRLTECLLHTDNVPRLLGLTGLASASLSEEGHVVLRAYTKKGLAKALGQLRRIAFHCQWGCTKEKVNQLLEGRPARPLNAVLVRMAATSSRLLSHEAKLTQKAPKLRIGTQSGGGSTTFQVEGIPGLSRKHCTVTFEPEKGACYIQDLSTNGTYLNGKRLPRPPFKNPQDARVRLFHGDEVFFRLKSEDAEELGFVVNLMPLS